MDTRKVGRVKEDAASEFLLRQGAGILFRNFRSRMGEIDIIASDHGTLCFIEVKYRKSVKKGYPAEAVGVRKQVTICRTADYYRMKMSLPEDLSYRFDVISIMGEEITWYKNAFSYIPYS